MHSNTLYLYFIIFVSTFQKIGNVDANDVKIDITTEEIDEARINKVVNNHFMEEDKDMFNSTQLKAVKYLVRELLMKTQEKERQINQLKQEKEELKKENNQKIETNTNLSSNVAVLKRDLEAAVKVQWTYEALLDMPKIIQNFIDECYPAWLQRPKNKDELYSSPSLEKVLLNLENPKIKSLKRHLRKEKMADETFVTTIMNDILARRNAYAHKLTIGAEQRKAIEHLIDGEYASCTDMRTALTGLMLFGCAQPKNGPILETYNEEDESIEAEIETKLETFKIMQIVGFNSDVFDERKLKMDFEKFVKKVNEVYTSKTPLNHPIAYCITSRAKLHLLFNSFTDAKNMFQHLSDFRKFVDFNPRQENTVLRNVSDLEREIMPQNYGMVKVETDKMTDEELKNTLQTMKDNPTLESMDLDPRVARDDKKKTISIFLQAYKIDELMILYEICKDYFKLASVSMITSSKISVNNFPTFDIHPQHTTIPTSAVTSAEILQT